MSEIINIYCDESCHLENDHQKAMILGALWCDKEHVTEMHKDILAIKKKHKLKPYVEIKWTKVSDSKYNFYEELINYFFDHEVLRFRGWIVPDKSVLQHGSFQQSHDEWYYKMYFHLLKNIIAENDTKYHIYLDIKDTRSRKRLLKLGEVLANAHYDFNRDIIEKIQHVHSHEIALMQLADLLIGALSYHARGLSGNSAKEKLVKLVQDRSGLSLAQNSLLTATKLNLCVWRANSGGL